MPPFLTIRHLWVGSEGNFASLWHAVEAVGPDPLWFCGVWWTGCFNPRNNQEILIILWFIYCTKQGPLVATGARTRRSPTPPRGQRPGRCRMASHSSTRVGCSVAGVVVFFSLQRVLDRRTFSNRTKWKSIPWKDFLCQILKTQHTCPLLSVRPTLCVCCVCVCDVTPARSEKKNIPTWMSRFPTRTAITVNWGDFVWILSPDTHK